MAHDAVILAGGLGTRLRPITGGLIPKVLVPVLGRPFIDYKLRSLAKLGVSRAVVLVGEGAEQITSRVKAGTDFGLEVEYVFDGPKLLGTAGAIGAALDHLPDRFWVTYGDSLVTADLHDAEALMARPGAAAVMTVLRNADRWEPSNVDLTDGLVSAYRKGPPPGTFQWIDYGLILFAKSCFQPVPEGTSTDLGVLVRDLIARRALHGYEVTDRFWDIGTPEGLRETEAHFRDVGMWERLQ